MLYYYKCLHCLTAFTTEQHYKPRELTCDCDGPTIYMGQVCGDTFVKTEDKSPCDDRCSHASGPHCDCKCGGVNHGTGKLVQVVVAEGKVKVTGLSEEDIERAIKYRKLRDYALDLFEKKWSSLGNLTWTDIRKRRDEKAKLDKIVEGKLYDKRNAALIAYIAANSTVAKV